MKIKLLIICIVITLGLSVAPAKADLFSFSFDNLQTVWTSGTGVLTADKTTDPITGTIGSVTRWEPPTDRAKFDWTIPGRALIGDFYLTMTLSSIVSTVGSESAYATGSFTIEDTDAVFDTITGDISGTWTRDDGDQANVFAGALSNVLWTDNNGIGDFDGHADVVGPTSVSMNVSAVQPWRGTLIELTATAPWFNVDTFDVTGGSVDATIVPVPAAVILAILGLGSAGLKLRKFA